MIEKFRRDSFGIGVTIGIVIPAILFGILFGVLMLVVHKKPVMLLNNPELINTLVPSLILISIIPSLILLRYYLLKLKFDKTGRGIVLATFLLGIVFIITQFAL